jgi:preprotein translocase subunit SecD
MRPIGPAFVALVCLAGCDAIYNPRRPLAKTATLDLYVVSASPTPRSKKAVDPATNTPIFLTTPAIITAADVATIQRSEDSPELLSITINLTPTGATKMAAATATPAGMRVAFVVNGTLISAPKLMSPLSNSFRVTGITKDRDQIFAALTD